MTTMPPAPAPTHGHPQPQAHAPTAPYPAPAVGGKGNTLVTNAPPDQAMALAQHAAAGSGFRVHPTSPWTFQAQKGSLVAGIFLGAFIAYCNFRVTIAQGPDGMTVVSIVRNVPWWTGAVGVVRVKKRADLLGDATGQALVSQGFQVLHHDRT